MIIFESMDNIRLKETPWVFTNFKFRVIPAVGFNSVRNKYELESFKSKYDPAFIYKKLVETFNNSEKRVAIDTQNEVFYFKSESDMVLFKFLFDESDFTDPK